jgi:hypothetical protein
LHAIYGNLTVQRMHANGVLQARLKIGRLNDPYEQEADLIAEQVLRMPEPVIRKQETPEKDLQTEPLVGAITPLIGQRAEDEEVQEPSAQEEAEAQAKASVRDTEEQEEPVQAATIGQRPEEEEIQSLSEEEDPGNNASPVQAEFLQRQSKDEEETAQESSLRRRPLVLRHASIIETPAHPRLLRKKAHSRPFHLLHKKAIAGAQPRYASEDISTAISSSRSTGKPLDPDMEADMGARFGADFGNVRVHDDSNADNMSRKLSAQAFTVGSDVYFSQGRYNPDTYDGKHLLAHELTHVVQQGGAVRKKALPISYAQRSIQRWSVKGIINKILSYIPGFTLLTVILGENPVTGDKVPRTGKLLIKGAMELIPVAGPILYGRLEETGSTEKAGAWLDKQMKALNITIPLVKKLIDIAWDRVSIWKGISGNKK